MMPRRQRPELIEARRLLACAYATTDETIRAKFLARADSLVASVRGPAIDRRDMPEQQQREAV